MHNYNLQMKKLLVHLPQGIAVRPTDGSYGQWITDLRRKAQFVEEEAAKEVSDEKKDHEDDPRKKKRKRKCNKTKAYTYLRLARSRSNANEITREEEEEEGVAIAHLDGAENEEEQEE